MSNDHPASGYHQHLDQAAGTAILLGFVASAFAGALVGFAIASLACL